MKRGQLQADEDRKVKRQRPSTLKAHEDIDNATVKLYLLNSNRYVRIYSLRRLFSYPHILKMAIHCCIILNAMLREMWLEVNHVHHV